MAGHWNNHARPRPCAILGDQLTRDLASLRGRTKDDTVILMMEVWDEATYVRQIGRAHV